MYLQTQRRAHLRKAETLSAVAIEEYVDAGGSARMADRPALMELIESVRTDSVAYCIMHKFDRLARNRADDAAIHRGLKEEAGGLAVSATETVDETPSGMLLHGIMSTIAGFYSRNIAHEVSKGMTQKAITGGTNGKAPLGYLNTTTRDEFGREVRTIEFDPKRGPLIRLAFEAYATGAYSAATLLEELIDRGLTTVPKPKQPEATPDLSSIQQMLARPEYWGSAVFKAPLTTACTSPSSPQVLVPGADGARRLPSVGEKTRARDHYLNGSVFCGTRGSRLILANAKSSTG